MTDAKMCGECERTLLDILDTVEFDTETGCWVETDRTPLFSMCRIYMAYICGDDRADPDFGRLHVCRHFQWDTHECCNPEHLSPPPPDEEPF